jgi:predicted nucleic acid-binding protein
LTYFDTSVVAAFYWPHTFSEQAQLAYQDLAPVTISTWVEVELVSALARLVRMNTLDKDSANDILSLFNQHLRQGLYRRLELLPKHQKAAKTLLARFDLPLRSADALHLGLVTSEKLSLITADVKLADCATRTDILVHTIGPPGV